MKSIYAAPEPVPLQTPDNRIISGAEWKDIDGKPIQAHGAGIIRVDNTWYWFGEDKTQNNQAFLGISCYTSGDLATWKRLPNVLQAVTGTPLNDTVVVERPKVIFNKKTNTFVMYFHYDSSNYGLAQVGVATSQNVNSNWKFQRAFSPLNSQSRDMSLFQDDDQDGSAYLSFASDGNSDLKLAKLSPDYLDVVELIYKWTPVHWEATGIIKNGGTYTLLYSNQAGWNPTPNSAMQATSLKGPWSSSQLIAPADVKTYSSQNSYDIVVKGTEVTSFIYAGDRWVEKALGTSRYVWLPLQIEGAQVKLQWVDVWSIDVATGRIKIETGTIYDIATAQVDGGRATFRHVVAPTHTLSQWCSIYYTSPGGTYRTGSISSNDKVPSPVNFPPVSGMISIPTPVQLNTGAENSIQITIPSGVTVKKIIIY